MGKYDKYSIPDSMSFEPDVVRRDIEELERIEAKGKLSHAGYTELALLKDYEEFHKEQAKKKNY